MYLCMKPVRCIVLFLIQIGNNIFVASHRKEYMDNIRSKGNLKSFIYLLSCRCILEGVKLTAFVVFVVVLLLLKFVKRKA